MMTTDSTTPPAPPTNKGNVLFRILAYCFCGLLVVLGTSILDFHLLRPWNVNPVPYAFSDDSKGEKLLVNKVAHYQANATTFNLVFLGDSRTYCGVQPEFIDPMLGSHSLNLASFANWFGTQYPMVKDIVDSVPKNAVVVWSVGHKNFTVGGEIPAVYPIGFENAAQMASMGVPPWYMAKNLATFTPLLSIFVRAGNLLDLIQAKADEAVLSPVKAQASSQTSALASVQGQGQEEEQEEDDTAYRFRLQPHIDSYNQLLADVKANRDMIQALVPVGENRLINSFILHMVHGGYIRVIIDPDYFEKKRKEDIKKRGGPLPDDKAQAENLDEQVLEYQMALFRKMLDMFQERGVKLIVNEIEEAPYTYRNPILKTRWRTWMRETIQPEVEKRGFKYIRANFDQFTDFDYFDYNHLHLQGIMKYAPMLVGGLQNALSDKGQ